VKAELSSASCLVVAQNVRYSCLARLAFVLFPLWVWLSFTGLAGSSGSVSTDLLLFCLAFGGVVHPAKFLISRVHAVLYFPLNKIHVHTCSQKNWTFKPWSVYVMYHKHHHDI
jgi:hypothetical protein